MRYVGFQHIVLPEGFEEQWCDVITESLGSAVRLQHHYPLPRLAHEFLKLISLLLLLPLDGLFSTQSDPLRFKSDHGTPLLKNLQLVAIKF